MKCILKVALLLILFSFSLSVNVSAIPPRAGFYMPDSIQEFSFTYQSFNNLIILPVTINDSVRLNLVLDTGCRNLVLFGKSFQKYFNVDPERKVNFSGLGSGKALIGNLSLKNKILIGSAVGENIPVVIVPHRGVFKNLDITIDGVIGYDIFIKFEIELNPATNKITFRPAMSSLAPEGYTKIPVRIEDSVPVLNSNIIFDQDNQLYSLMIDTGSSLGLLLKTTDLKKFKTKNSSKLIGRGFNGDIKGFEMTADKIILSGYEMESLSASITESPWHNHASIGMEILKEYSVILNYVKEYVCLKKV